MGHPYRSPSDPSGPAPRRPDRLPDPEIAAVLVITLIAAACRVVWAVLHRAALDGDSALALGVALACLALLWPTIRWAIRRAVAGRRK
ncbi:MAG: hypothetical protein HYY06_05580 [Deltaproteobacteria bacterium]|nr:hypothetical protein [Deltaproteobacteria bacterium]